MGLRTQIKSLRKTWHKTSAQAPWQHMQAVKRAAMQQHGVGFDPALHDYKDPQHLLSPHNPNIALGGIRPVEYRWKEVLEYVVNPHSPRLVLGHGTEQTTRTLLQLGQLDEDTFWAAPPSERLALFLHIHATFRHGIPSLEFTPFDLLKLEIEQNRREPMTMGAAWHYGFWRAYFAHAAITHPANDGLREEFDTSWRLVRRYPYVIQKHAESGETTTIRPLQAVQLDLPLLIGQLPLSDGYQFELAYLRAMAEAELIKASNMIEASLWKSKEDQAPPVCMVSSQTSVGKIREERSAGKRVVLRLTQEDLFGMNAHEDFHQKVQAVEVIELEYSDDHGKLLHFLSTLKANHPNARFSFYTPNEEEKTKLKRLFELSLEKDRIKIRTLVTLSGTQYMLHKEAFRHCHDFILPRIGTSDFGPEGRINDQLQPLIRDARIVELHYNNGGNLDQMIQEVLTINSRALISVYLEGDSIQDNIIVDLAKDERVVLLNLHFQGKKSYHEIPRIHKLLLQHRLRNQVQIATSGSDTDSIRSAADGYEMILRGADGAVMTDAASLALDPTGINVYQNPGSKETYTTAIAELAPDTLAHRALNSLTCWRLSILDFLSAMGIDSAGKTVGNFAAITDFAEWVRTVDETLSHTQLGAANETRNTERVQKLPIPQHIREKFKPSEIVKTLDPSVPPVDAKTVYERGDANFALGVNRNPNLTADALYAIYRAAEGNLEALDVEKDFLVKGRMGPDSIDGVGVKVSAASIQKALDAFRADPTALDYINLALPYGLLREGAVPSRAEVKVSRDPAGEDVITTFQANADGGFSQELPFAESPPETLYLSHREKGGTDWQAPILVEASPDHAAFSVCRASQDGKILLKQATPLAPHTFTLEGYGFREPIFTGPINHSSMSLGSASEPFLAQRVVANSGLPEEYAKFLTDHSTPLSAEDEGMLDELDLGYAMVSSGEGGPIRIGKGPLYKYVMKYEELQAASAHFGNEPLDLRNARAVEIKINQGAKPGKGGRLAAAKVTLVVSRNRNIPERIDALSPDPKHDIYSIEDMPAEVWLWLIFHVHCGIKISPSPFSEYVMAGMFSTGVVDSMLIDAGIGGSGNYHGDSSHVGWPDILRSIGILHHKLMKEGNRDWNGQVFGAKGSTQIIASGGIKSEFDMLKVILAGADSVKWASGDKAVAFGCQQCGRCFERCPRGGITTDKGLEAHNDPTIMRRRYRNWTAMSMIKLAILTHALNIEHGLLDDPEKRFDDMRKLRGRVDMLNFPTHAPSPAPNLIQPAENDHGACRLSAFTCKEPVDVKAIQEALRVSSNGGNDRGGGILFAGFAPPAVKDKTLVMFNTLGNDREERRETMKEMFKHFQGLNIYNPKGEPLDANDVLTHLDEHQVPVREQYKQEAEEQVGWQRAGLRENPGDFYRLFFEIKPEVLEDYARQLLASDRWLQRTTKYHHLSDTECLTNAAFFEDVKKEYFTVLSHILDREFYSPPAGQDKPPRRGYVVSMGEDIAELKICGWAHLIPEYFDFENFWGPGEVLRAHTWGGHHRFPTNSPAIDEAGRGNPAGAHGFKAYNMLLMHNGEQVGVDATAPILEEFGVTHLHSSMYAPRDESYIQETYAASSLYQRKFLTDTEYAVLLEDYLLRVLGLTPEEASQIISPITGRDLNHLPEQKRKAIETLFLNYQKLIPVGPYRFTVVESRKKGDGKNQVGIREHMDLKFLRPHSVAYVSDQVVLDGSEEKANQASARILYQQGVLPYPTADGRFSMRPGGKTYGGVMESYIDVNNPQNIFTTNRYGKNIPLSSQEVHFMNKNPIETIEQRVSPEFKTEIQEQLDAISKDKLSIANFLETLKAALKTYTFEQYRYLCEIALVRYTQQGSPAVRGRRTAQAIQLLTELRKQMKLIDLGKKSYGNMKYITDGGERAPGEFDGGLYRIFDALPPLWEGLHEEPFVKINHAHRDDLRPPHDREQQTLVIDFSNFASESFDIDNASMFLTEAVKKGWKNIIGYNFRGGPRRVGTNLAHANTLSAEDVAIHLYGREFGDFGGALFEGAKIFFYGEGQSHYGMIAHQGLIFVLDDVLNTALYTAHGGTLNAWNAGSRFAVAAQNKVTGPGLKSILFGSPNEYAFEYLMSGGKNAIHVILGLQHGPHGKLQLRTTPYGGKFLMSGAAAGRVILFDPKHQLDPSQYVGNTEASISEQEWQEEIAPFILEQAALRGIPLKVNGNQFSICLEGNWTHYEYQDAFKKIVPQQSVVTSATIDQWVEDQMTTAV